MAVNQKSNAQGRRRYAYSKTYSSKAEPSSQSFLDAHRRRDENRAEHAGAAAKLTVGPTVAEWVEQWLELLAVKAKPSTVRTDAASARKWLAGTTPAATYPRRRREPLPVASARFGQFLLSEVTPVDWRAVLTAARAAGLSETTVNGIARLARRVWRAG